MDDWKPHDGSEKAPFAGLVEVDLGRDQFRRGYAAEFNWGWGGEKTPSYGHIQRYRRIKK